MSGQICRQRGLSAIFRFSYVWGDLRQKSQAGLARHAGEVRRATRYELVGVRFDGASTRYTTCEVHRDTVRDGSRRERKCSRSLSCSD